MLDDEEHLVVVGRQRCLRVENAVETQIVAVTHRPREIESRTLISVLVTGTHISNLIKSRPTVNSPV